MDESFSSRYPKANFRGSQTRDWGVRFFLQLLVPCAGVLPAAVTMTPAESILKLRLVLALTNIA